MPSATTKRHTACAYYNMLQTLFYIPAQLAGYPLFGFGLLLAVWAVASVGVLAYLAWRQGFNADTWGYVPILLLIGAIIWWVLPAICEPQGLPIHGYGVMMLLAVVAATLLAAWRAHAWGSIPRSSSRWPSGCSCRALSAPGPST